MKTEPAREWMINHQIRPWHVNDCHVLDAMAHIKRERFVPAQYRDLAFADTAIPLARNQFMLKPVLEGRLLQALDPHECDSVLLIGAGSGYLTACVAAMARHVTAIELHPELTALAEVHLRDQRVRNVDLVTDDFETIDPGTTYDRIIVTGSLPMFDPRLPYWLNPDGRIVLITGTEPTMRVEVVTRSQEHYQRIGLFETVVPALEGVPHGTEFRF